MNMPVTFVLSAVFALTSLFAQQPTKPQPVQLPELPKRDVPLVPAPIRPPQVTQRQNQSATIEFPTNIVFANGALYIKLGDVFLAGPGSCCFCPDGVERKPLTQLEVKRLKQSAGSKSNH